MTSKSIKNVIGLVAITALASVSLTANAASAYTHSRTLKVGSRGLAVESLQDALNACWDLGLTADGIFGKGTRAAVMAAQKDLGLKADGVVGPMTGAAIEDCDGAVVTPTTPTTPTTPGTLTPGAELRTRNFQIRNASNSSVEEGARGVEVARVQFDTQYSDAKLERIDLVATPNGTVPSPTTPWRVFDRVMIKVNDTQVASFDTANATMWDEVSSGVYRLRLSGLTAILPKDRTQNISILADINSGANGGSGDVKWDISLGADAQGIRMLDQAGITQYVGLASTFTGTTFGTDKVASNAAVLTIKNLGGLSTVRVTASSNDPVSKTLMANKNTASSAMLVHSYTVKAEEGDIKIKTVPVKLDITEASGGTQATVSSTDYGALYKAVIDSTWIEINGTRFDSITSKSSADNTTYETDTINFDVNRNFTITSGSTATINVYVKLASMPDNSGNPNANSGATIKSSVTGTTLALETGMYDAVPSNSITGSATGYVHTIRTSGVVATMGTASIARTTNNSGQTTAVEYTIPLTLTASGNTFYIGQSAEFAATSTLAADGASAKALAFTLQSASAASTDITSVNNSVFTNGTADGTVISTLSSSNASIQNLGYRLDDGSAKNFTLKVTATAASDGTTDSLRVALKTLKFYNADTLADGAGETVFTLLPVENFRTEFQTLTR
ncbi:MAG TPA: peptidoglycan-binding domain-containing protein [Candidatus Paceibacterota bacterium]